MSQPSESVFSCGQSYGESNRPLKGGQCNVDVVTTMYSKASVNKDGKKYIMAWS